MKGNVILAKVDKIKSYYEKLARQWLLIKE